ncbi:histidine kinase [Dechloromonas sp. XY25]|uniref:histidine kinase n=1 Tax=Dechloromonas hankyongensis TaxID=2908002 RepID=A0ABS9JZZ8_9RHOO|nr:histidine kinase [Dechloromonas hankyongensis]MCG2576473.1 histidine kinase [Dechloromonas hankyongensis]
MTSNGGQLAASPGLAAGNLPQIAPAGRALLRPPESRRLIESLRVMLAIIAGLLMFDVPPENRLPLAIGVLAFSIYAAVILWLAANGATGARHRVFCWLDAAWFLLLLGLAGERGVPYFQFLLFPVYFAAWRSGYRESVAIAAFAGLSSIVVFALQAPGISWERLLALPLSLLLVGPISAALARGEAAIREEQAFAASVVEGLDSRRGFDALIPELIARIARPLGASAALLAVHTFEGRSRIFCWETESGPAELSALAAQAVAEQVLSLTPDLALGWSGAQRWWEHDRLLGFGPARLPLAPGATDRAIAVALAGLTGRNRLLSVPLSPSGIGRVRLILAGDMLPVSVRWLEMLAHIVDQVGPSVENAYLRERLATEAADTERARIGRDLHDSAIQPYIGLKFAIEAVQRRAGRDTPLAADLERLVAMASEELASMREVISGLRGAPGKGGALLSSAVRRQAQRFGQLFGIAVEVEVAGEMPVSRRIAGEVFHIVAEGLSNIRRHTQARRAWISLNAAGGMLVLGIRNPNDAGKAAAPRFTPISLSERAAALGGSLELDCDAAGTTVTVRVPIPVGRAKGRT